MSPNFWPGYEATSQEFTGEPPYPSGVYQSQEPAEPSDNVEPGDDPSFVDNAVIEMSGAWGPIDCCIGGTQYFRENAAVFLPQEPKEDESAWKRRISHATFAPYVVRIAEQAAGLILRKPIQVTAETEGQRLDPYWEEFKSNVDGFGTDIDSYARKLLIGSLMYGHASILVDYPATEAAPNLAEERLRGLRPYFVTYDAKSILGWRRDEGSPTSPITMVRLNEYVSEPMGEFGDQLVRQIRICEANKWRVYRKGGKAQKWMVISEGVNSLGVIPIATTYSNKLAEFISKPPLLPIADLNILHSQRNADLQHSLHVAALPILVLQGYDDQGNGIGLSANSAILLPPEGSASYVEPASSAFQAQSDYLQMLEEQMSSLGISTLFGQKASAETAESKRLSRTDSDSILSLISQDLEEKLQQAFDMAAAYTGKDSPKVLIDRDFDTQSLDAGQVGQYLTLWTQGAITHETLLGMLQRGEVLPDIDIELEVEMVSNEKLDSMMLATAAPAAMAKPETNKDEEDSDDTGDIREAMQDKLREKVKPKEDNKE